MNTKIIAIAIVAVLAIAGVTTAIILTQPKDSASYDAAAYQLVGRVNSEGSGLFINEDLVKTVDGMPVNKINNVPFFGTGYTYTSANKDAWGGLVFGDPGEKTIQHVQLNTIAAGLGLKFARFVAGQATSSDTLYYVPGLGNAGVMLQSEDINGGIIWEPQFEIVIESVSKNYTTLALTNNIFKDHTCCVIAANYNWLNENPAVAVKFLAGYIKAVDYINDTKAAGGAQYDALVESLINLPLGWTDSVVRNSLEKITYLYADDENGSLSELIKDMKKLADDVNALGLITTTKFNDSDKFSKAFVNDSYMKDAVAGKASKTGTDSVTVAVINGDIHQLAIQIAIDKEYFAEYGLTVTLNKTPTNGQNVSDLLVSGDAKIGFLGAPPATLNTINGDHILV